MTELVGIVNVTPNSFSDGGQFFTPEKAIAQAERLFADGAAIVDIGAESTGPKAEPISAEEEWQRLRPVLRPLVDKYSGRLSLDTYHPETAERGLRLDEHLIINDVTGMNNPEMVEVVTRYKAKVIISHLRGADVQAAHRSTRQVNSILEVADDLMEKARLLESRGIPKENIILDPGIGFGKTAKLNKRLVRFAEQVPGYKVMIGYSKKRFLGERRMELEPNLRAGKEAMSSGAVYLRVHDVAGHKKWLFNRWRRKLI